MLDLWALIQDGWFREASCQHSTAEYAERAQQLLASVSGVTSPFSAPGFSGQ